MDKQREMFEAWWEDSFYGVPMSDMEECVGWQAWQAAITAQQGSIISLPEPGTTEYGSWINKAKDKADQCFASHGKDRFKWLCQFEQHLRKSANGGEK